MATDGRTAARAVRRAEVALDEAERALAGARIELDIALAGEGWTLLCGGYGSRDVQLYQRPNDAMSTVTLPDLLARLGVAARPSGESGSRCVGGTNR